MAPDKKKAVVKHSRSRSGCLECRKKRKACDEGKPSCQRCEKQNIKCTYKISLQFKEDLELKGAAFGREGIWNKKTNTAKKNNAKSNDLSILAADHYQLNNYMFPGRLYFVNVTTNDFLSTPRLMSSVYPNNEIFISDDGSSNFALSYYFEHVSPIFNPVKSLGDNNGGVDFSTLIQYSHQSNGDYVFNMLLAIGSCYLIRQNSSYWKKRAIHYKNLAMQEIKRKLESSKIESILYDLLLSSLLLCLYDLADDCNDDWSEHIKMVQWVLNHSKLTPSNETESKILSFTIDFFGYQEAMGRTACRNVSIFDTDYWEEQNKGSIVSWMGCNKKLVSTISDITDLSYERISMNQQDYLILAKKIENDINNQNFAIEISNKEKNCFLLGCECKKLATKIYFYCALLNKSPKDHIITELIEKLSNFLEYIVIENNYCWSFLIWPTFIMATQIDPLNSNCESLRALTLDLFTNLELNTLGNVNKSREIILGIWNKRDLQETTTTSSIKSNSKNDWEFYIANKELNISLS